MDQGKKINKTKKDEEDYISVYRIYSGFNLTK